MFWLELASRDPDYVLEMSRQRIAISQMHVKQTMQRVRNGAASRRGRAVRHLSPPDRDYMALRRWLEQDGAAAATPPPS